MAFWQLSTAPNSFSAGALPGPEWGAYNAPLDPLAGLKGPNSKASGVEGEGKGEKKGERKGMGGTPSQISGSAPGNTYTEIK